MKRILAGLLLAAATAPAWSADPCAGKVAAAIVTHDRELREGAGLLVNHCVRPVRVDILVMAHNRDGFPVARLRTTIQAGAAPLSVFRISLPFVQSVVALSGYSSEIAATESLDVDGGRTAALDTAPLPVAPRL